MLPVEQAARAELNRPYRWGGRALNGADCVGRLYRWFRAAGRPDLVDNSWTVGHLRRWYGSRAIRTSDIGRAHPGDILIFGADYHCGLYLGGGQFISGLSRGVAIRPVVALVDEHGRKVKVSYILPTGLWSAPVVTPPAGPPAPIPVPPKITSYTVRAGDTLASISLAQYGTSTAWSTIYEANRVVIGANPNLIRPDQVLVIPPKP